MIWHKFNEESPPPYKDVAFYYYGAVFTGGWLPRWKSFDMHEPTACAPIDNSNPYKRISISDFDLENLEWCDLKELRPNEIDTKDVIDFLKIEIKEIQRDYPKADEYCPRIEEITSFRIGQLLTLRNLLEWLEDEYEK